MTLTTHDHYPAQAFTKQDPSDDDQFYAFPRMVSHIDNGAIAYLRDSLYADVLPANGRWLDLMSSRYSHLPDEPQPSFVHATGMNRAELEANPALDDFVVHNFNKSQSLPFEDSAFDAALCCVSVQYLEKPLEVFAEVRRVLAPGAPFVVSFSNRCFPTKAMRIWRERSDAGHVELVTEYMTLTGYGNIETRAKQGGLFAGDPLYAV
ncbi:MAG: methyltransferase domain-containing protein, partial [Chloroflexota bacterium]